MADEVYRTIKSLVFDFVRSRDGHVDYDQLTAEVTKHFPDSKWKKTHWAWYRTQITRGRFRELFPGHVREALSKGKLVAVSESRQVAEKPEGASRGPQAKDPEVKRLGDAILSHVRLMLDLAAQDDVTKRFKLNRWVFSRLLQDEVRVKRPVKQKLWDSGVTACQACGEPFKSTKNVEIHRTDASAGYSVENCELLCRDCHQEIGS